LTLAHGTQMTDAGASGVVLFVARKGVEPGGEPAEKYRGAAMGLKPPLGAIHPSRSQVQPAAATFD
jgi:hypothetical protein